MASVHSRGTWARNEATCPNGRETRRSLNPAWSAGPPWEELQRAQGCPSRGKRCSQRGGDGQGPHRSALPKPG